MARFSGGSPGLGTAPGMTPPSPSSGRSDLVDRTRPPVTAYGRTVRASNSISVIWSPHRGPGGAVDRQPAGRFGEELRRQRGLGARDEHRHLVADEADVAAGLGH